MPGEPLKRLIKALPDSPNAAAAAERLREAAESQGATANLGELESDPSLAKFLKNALGDSPYLLDLAVNDVARLTEIISDAPSSRIDEIVGALAAAKWDSRDAAMASLRRAKQDVALTLGLADLGGALDVQGVTALLTRFADAALSSSLRFALAEARHAGKWSGPDEARGFFILGMGKYGAGELNYSSDIDIIALFDPEAEGPTNNDPSTFWVGIVRQLVALLQTRTRDGYVFRVDLRLRPDPAATRVAISAPAALLYYESMGQNWERAALIKARAVAGDIPVGNAFIRELAPFIWRKYLDFAAIADIHSIKRQVHAHRGHATVRVLGHDIKRGRGGIREIEFFVQTQQLIAGGREPALRGTATREMLRELAARGWIDEAAREELDGAYVLLRNVEHRLQMVRDEQTHQMPHEREELARIARLMRAPHPAEFEAELRRALEAVARRYSELFESGEELSGAGGSLVFTGGEDDPETIETLRGLGFATPEFVTDTVRGWHFGRFSAMRSTTARENLTEITPALLKAFSRAGNPDAAVRAFDSLLKALPAGAQLFALLRNNPDLLDLLATVLSAAPRLAEVFARRPHVADALIDPSRLAEVGGLADVKRALEQSLGEARRYEDVLDRARLFVAERRFLISVGLLTESFAPSDAGKAFSDLAEAVVAALFERTRSEFALKHGRLPGGQAAVVGFGRLGSREMTASSDLDLIIIYDHEHDVVSDGARPLAPSLYYARLTQRLIAALSAPTAEGIAYSVDLRLRPSGQAGPLATHIEAFEHYQLNEAWTWEHMAMSRGRAIAGDPSLMQRTSAVIDALVAQKRDLTTLAADVASMRARIEREKTPANAFDLKLARGGLMDCEFAAQFLVLSGLGRMPGETTLETLERGAADGRVPPDAGERLVLSTSLQAALLQIVRVAEPTAFSPKAAPEALRRIMVAIADKAFRDSGVGAERAGVSGFEELEKRLVVIQAQTRTALEKVLGTAVA